MMKQVNKNRIRGCMAALGAVVFLTIAGCGGCRETSNPSPVDTWVNYVPGGSTGTGGGNETGGVVPTDPPSSGNETGGESDSISPIESETNGTAEDGVELATPHGSLYYSSAWENVLTQPRQSQEGDRWVVSFGVTLGGTEYPLFDVLIGEAGVQGLIWIGELTDNQGEVHTVYVRTPSDEAAPTEGNMYWKQYCAVKEEQINFIMSHLA